MNSFTLQSLQLPFLYPRWFISLSIWQSAHEPQHVVMQRSSNNEPCK